ncbi:amidohydrolase [Apiospora hydei]|uniref:Amidohydrolase n=1 Tax=Apiospora hydei TaxID=1337664 RepID=A0ABR1VTE4_9PEZI
MYLPSVESSPEDLHRVGILNTSTPIVISQASQLTTRGARLLRATNQYISVTAESEMHFGHLHPTSHIILGHASFGVDTHMAFSTDILTQARFWLQSARYRVYAEIVGRWQAFLLTTRNGWLTVKRDDLGIISFGAKADLVV